MEDIYQGGIGIPLDCWPWQLLAMVIRLPFFFAKLWSKNCENWANSFWMAKSDWTSFSHVYSYVSGCVLPRYWAENSCTVSCTTTCLPSRLSCCRNPVNFNNFSCLRQSTRVIHSPDWWKKPLKVSYEKRDERAVCVKQTGTSNRKPAISNRTHRENVRNSEARQEGRVSCLQASVLSLQA